MHDQIVIETIPEDAEGAREWLVKAMTGGMREFTDPVPVKVDTKIVTSERKEEE